MIAIMNPDRVGEVVAGKYRIVRFVAAGGMGTVFEAEHLSLGRRIALKFLHPALAGDRSSLARFEREARSAGGIRSEYVVVPLDFGIASDGAPFFAMEFLDGESLRAILDRGAPLPVGRATDLVAQACLGAQAAHDLGIIHRDLNPRNIHVGRRSDGTDWVKILDFGIAKLDESAVEETATGAMLGTPAYVAPEQARGEKAVDHRVDIYALGSMLFELLSGQRPHPGESRNAILHHVCTQPPLSLATLRPDLPVDLVTIIHRALASARGERQASAADLARDLSPWVKREAWPSPTTGLDSVTVAPPSMAATPAAPVLPSPARRWPYVVGGGLVIAMVALFALLGRPSPGLSISRPPLPSNTRLYVPAVNPAAVQQIAGLVKSGATSQAAALTTMGTMPRGIWLLQGTPEEVRSMVAKAVVLAARGNTIPVFVTYNRPFRDCAGYSAGGALNSADYRAWIEGLARGIGNERAMVILEPDGTGIIPYYTRLDGTAEWCKPVVTDGTGKTVPAPGASDDESFGQLNDALAIFKKQAPNALVYLDSTHSNWLSVAESAHRLVKAGVASARGFALNVGNFQTTWKQVYYGSWIATCIDNAAAAGNTPEAFRACPNQPGPTEARSAWEAVDAWYVQRRSPSHGNGIRFVIDTSRNGQGPLDPRKYAAAPFNQPDRVLAKLDEGSWCNPPGVGVGERPTVNTRIPLLDAYLWLKDPGESDGSCDIASGARAWDFDQHNPWGLKGDTRNRFDPLWGMVVPAAGIWFPEQALELAANGNPPVIP